MAAIQFNRDYSPEYYKVEQLSPLVRRVVAKNPNPFTFTGTGVYLIGRGEVAVIDPGPSLAENIDAITNSLDPGEKITHILVTHTHSDHTAGVSALVEKTGAVTYGYGPHGPVPDEDPLDKLTFDEYFTDAEREEIEKEWADIPEELKREGADQDFVPDFAVKDCGLISGLGWTIEAVHTPGHTSNHLCYALTEEKVLFTGDHVMGWATSVISPPDGDLFDYMESLRKLVDRDDVRYFPTHGPHIDDPQTYVQSFIEHRVARERQILGALKGKTASIKSIVPDIYAAVDKRLWRAAANSVYSHLLALHREGRVEADPQPSLTAEWSLCS